MCSRLSFITTSEKIQKELNIQVEGLLRTSYNISPTQHCYIIKNSIPDQLDYVTWGIIPHWSLTGKNEGKLIHARAENIITSTSFRIPIRQRRCLVVVDSFYDMTESNDPKNCKARRFFSPNGELITIAGVWDTWLKDNYELKSFSIITNKEDLSLTTRLPLIIQDSEKRRKWLSDIPIDEIVDLLQSTEIIPLDFHYVSYNELVENTNSFQLHLRID